MDTLRSIPGPVFLGVYISVLAIATWLGRRWIRSDDPLVTDPPECDRLHPDALALLRGGDAEAIRTALFRLGQRQAITWERGLGRRAGSSVDRIQAAPGASIDDPLAAALLKRIAASPPTPHALMQWALQDPQVRAELDRHRTGLCDSRLLQEPGTAGRAWFRALVVLGGVLALGIAKLCLALAYDRPHGFLVVLLVASPLLLVALRPWRRTTTAGEQVLRQARTRFDWMQRRRASTSDVDPVWAMAAFGVSAIAVSTVQPELERNFRRESAAGSGCGSGCSASGCGSGDGGGGCGGCGGGGD